MISYLKLMTRAWRGSTGKSVHNLTLPASATATRLTRLAPGTSYSFHLFAVLRANGQRVAALPCHLIVPSEEKSILFHCFKFESIYFEMQIFLLSINSYMVLNLAAEERMYNCVGTATAHTAVCLSLIWHSFSCSVTLFLSSIPIEGGTLGPSSENPFRQNRTEDNSQLLEDSKGETGLPSSHVTEQTPLFYSVCA